MTCRAPDVLVIRKGESFLDVIRWSTKPPIYKTITAATRAAPCVLTVPLHGMPDGWRISRITGVAGMKELNTHQLLGGQWSRTPLGQMYGVSEALYDEGDESGIDARVIDANTIALDSVNAASFGQYASGGVIQYWTPVDLLGFTAEMDIRDSPGASATLLELSTANGRIVLNNAAKTITRTIAHADVDAITWSEGQYTLELLSPAGVKTILDPKPGSGCKTRRVVICDLNVTR